MSVPTAPTLSDQLQENAQHRRFADHAFFRQVHRLTFTRAQVETYLGQWWHPLHYFTTFLPRCIAVVPDMESKSAITRILSQEVGGRTAKGAHEVIYVRSMEQAGYSAAAVTQTPPFPETRALLDGYERLSGDRFSALGAIFATEVTDLLMVSSIGEAVRRQSGQERNAWVDIHVQQEPEHVEEANHTLLAGFTPQEERQILDAAEEMWRLWTGFFDRLTTETGLWPSGIGDD